MRRPGRGLSLALLAAGAGLLAAGGAGPPAASPHAQPPETLIAVSLPDGGEVRTAVPFRSTASGMAMPLAPRFRWVGAGAPAKLAPPLDGWLRDSLAERRVDVVIGYDDPMEFPRLPLEGLDAPDSAAAGAAARAVRAAADSIRRRRAAGYRTEVARLERDFGARVAGTHVLTRSVSASLELREIARLAERRDVTSIQLAFRGAPPPAECPSSEGVSTSAYPCEARERIGTDPYRAAGQAGRRVVMLDTGVNTGHGVFAGLACPPAGSLAHGLCTSDWSDPECSPPAPPGDLHLSALGHGTKTASLLAGTGALGEEYRGVTNARLEAHRVYRAAGCVAGTADFAAEGFLQVTERFLDPGRAPSVLLVEAQDGSGPFGEVARRAERLFEMGAVVIAPVGNTDAVPEGSVGSPGISSSVLATGARMVHDYGATHPLQAHAWVPLLRGKPDLQAPTQTLGARGDDDDEFSALPNTSGAGPYAAGAARIVRNLLEGPWTPGARPRRVDPGQVYAALLAFTSGNRPYPVESGAGPFRLPSAGHLYAGKSMVGSMQSRMLEIPVPPGTTGRCRVALWWRDPPPARLPGGWLWAVVHLDVDLEARMPGSDVVRSSSGVGGVFETVTGKLGLPGKGRGPLRVRIIGRNVGSRPIPVHWAVVVTPD